MIIHYLEIVIFNDIFYYDLFKLVECLLYVFKAALS